MDKQMSPARVLNLFIAFFLHFVLLQQFTQQSNFIFYILSIQQMQEEYEPIEDKKILEQAIQIKKRVKKESYLLKWDKLKSLWTIWDPLSNKPNLRSLQNLTTMTLNVLFDRQGYNNHSQSIINSRLRYQYILKKVEGILPDVISFNQVTPLFYQMLKECSWAKQHYWISQFKINMGNMILTKIQPLFSDKFKVYTCPRLIEGVYLPTITKQGKVKIYGFFSVHLTAYESNVGRRTYQFDDLSNYIQSFEQIVDGFVLQGDMNFHQQKQRSIFQKYNFRDSWLQIYNLEQNPGYTFDSSQNAMINQIYWGFQKRRMRLDRILLKGPSLRCKQIKVNFNQPIYNQKKEVERYNFIKGAFLFLNDLLKSQMLRGKDKESYLYASDHFGLIADIKLQK